MPVNALHNIEVAANSYDRRYLQSISELLVVSMVEMEEEDSSSQSHTAETEGVHVHENDLIKFNQKHKRHAR